MIIESFSDQQSTEEISQKCLICRGCLSSLCEIAAKAVAATVGAVVNIMNTEMGKLNGKSIDSGIPRSNVGLDNDWAHSTVKY